MTDKCEYVLLQNHKLCRTASVVSVKCSWLWDTHKFYLFSTEYDEMLMLFYWKKIKESRECFQGKMSKVIWAAEKSKSRLFICDFLWDSKTQPYTSCIGICVTFYFDCFFFPFLSSWHLCVWAFNIYVRMLQTDTHTHTFTCDQYKCRQLIGLMSTELYEI